GDGTQRRPRRSAGRQRRVYPMNALVELVGVEKTFRIGGGAVRAAGGRGASGAAAANGAAGETGGTGAASGEDAGAAGRRVQVLKGVELSLVPGELVMLRGRSGSGKTTLLNIAGGLDDPTAGEARFDGKALGG